MVAFLFGFLKQCSFLDAVAHLWQIFVGDRKQPGRLVLAKEQPCKSTYFDDVDVEETYSEDGEQALALANAAEQSYDVHTLYKPPEGVEHTATIILFHGLSRGHNEWEATWMSRGLPRKAQVCWPKVWLPKYFGGKVVVLAPAYDAGPRGVNDDVKEIGHNLRVSLLSKLRSELTDSEEVRPIILLGHSFGGLVIKSLICEAQSIANQRCKNPIDWRAAADCQVFLANLKGVVFYSVPHTGTPEDFLKFWTQCSGNVEPREGRLAGIMKNLKAASRKMQQLTEDFQNYVPPGMPVFAFTEGKFMPGTEKLLVPEASAMQTARKLFYKVEGADHFEVCRPLREEDEAYRQLLEFLDGAAGPLVQRTGSTTALEQELLL